MKFSELANRLTGISTPIFGVSWSPPPLDVDIAQRLLIFLEDRRVLFNSFHDEMWGYVINSVLEIRKRLTSDLENIEIRSTELGKSLDAMRAACRQFLDRAERFERQNNPRYWSPGFESKELAIALGELRGVFGIHIARICLAYGIDVAGPLENIIPPTANGTD